MRSMAPIEASTASCSASICSGLLPPLFNENSAEATALSQLSDSTSKTEKEKSEKAKRPWNISLVLVEPGQAFEIL